MKNTLRTTLALAVLATLAPGQSHGEVADATAALARAKVLEEQEGDIEAAMDGYGALVAGSTTGPVHDEAALRLGALLWRLDRRADATPFLQRAQAAGGAIGSEAQRILQGQGDSDKAAQERLVRARAVTARLDDLLQMERHSPNTRAPAEAEALAKSIASARSELSFLGDAAATALAERLREMRRATPMENSDGVEKDSVVLALADCLWEIGTAPAGAYLAEVATDPMVGWRRAIASKCSGAAPDLHTTAVRFLRDGDPTGDVQRSAAALAHELPADLLVQLVTDTVPDCRAAGWTGFAKRWHRIPAAEQEALVARLGNHLVDAVVGDDLRVRGAANALRWQLAMQGPQAGRRIVLDLLAKAPHTYGVSDDGARAFVLADDEMRTLVAAGRALGRCPGHRFGTDECTSSFMLTKILALAEPRWTGASIDGLLELLELDYGRSALPPRWLDPFLARANATQVARLIAALPRLPSTRSVLDALLETKVGADAFPAIRATLEQALAGTTEGWTAIGRNTMDGKEVERAGPEAILLVVLAGRTGHADAASWLGDLAQRHPALADVAAGALVNLSIDASKDALDDEGTRAQMRTLLVWPGATNGGLSRSVRELLFAELTRRGDVPAIALFPRAFELGFDRSNHRIAAAEKFEGMQRLGAFDGATWHGYGPGHLAKAWDTLLQEAPGMVAHELVTGRNAVPLVALPAFVRALPTLAKTFAAGDRERYLPTLVDKLEGAGAADVAAGSDLRAAFVDLLRDGDPQIVVLALQRLNAPVLRELATEARAAIRRVGSPGHLIADLHRAGIVVTTDEWRAGLQSAEWNRCLHAMPADVDGTLQREVAAMLASSVTMRRIAACSALARWLSTDAVGPLLGALRDPSAEVRTAAKEALERIRFQQEQQSFWAGAKDGIDTSPAATASKLLAQARPGQAKEQRLLAIRSLEALGSNEALPHLIDWTKDGDAEVAAAARKALATIHQKASAPK